MQGGCGATRVGEEGTIQAHPTQPGRATGHCGRIGWEKAAPKRDVLSMDGLVPAQSQRTQCLAPRRQPAEPIG